MITVPEPGHTVQLNIDSAFQQAVDKASCQEHRDDKQHLQQRQAPQGCRRCGGGHQHEGRQCAGCPNHPSYDQNLFATQYSQYSSTRPAPAQPRVAGPVHPRLHLPGLRWQWRRWIPASTAFPPSTATVSIPIMTTTAPSVPATATAATSTPSRPSSELATSSSRWAAAPPVIAHDAHAFQRKMGLVLHAWRSMRPPAA